MRVLIAGCLDNTHTGMVVGRLPVHGFADVLPSKKHAIAG